MLRNASSRGSPSSQFDCPFNKSYSPVDCQGTSSGKVQLTHNGKQSARLSLATASGSDIASAFRVLRDVTYSGVTATVLHNSQETVVWRLELVTPWASCTDQLSLPLLGTINRAKVNATVVVESRASCLSGGVYLSLASSVASSSMAVGSPASVLGPVFLPWDASEYLAAERINQLLVADGSTVKVHRTGDGHAVAIFTITFLGLGPKPMLQIEQATGWLLKRTLANASSADFMVRSDANASIEELVRGGVDLLPLPGRYLTAPANESVVSVRLRSQTTATCGRVDWDTALYVGCFQVGLVEQSRWSAYAGVTAIRTTSFLHGWSKMTLERCEQSCRGLGAVAFAIFDRAHICQCLNSEPDDETSAPRYNCSIVCGADETQICGGELTQACSAAALAAQPPTCTAKKLFASVYRMPPSKTSLPCRFELDSSATPILSAAYPLTLPKGATLTIEGTRLAESGYNPPVVQVCGGTRCPVLSANDTHILCKMPTCSAAATMALSVHLSPVGYAANMLTIVARGVLTLTKVHLSMKSNTSHGIAEGSAAGGVLLTAIGSGFDDLPAAMTVELVDATGELLAPCLVLTSSASGKLVCMTQSAAEPLAMAGMLCSIRVSVQNPEAGIMATAVLADAYRFLAAPDSMYVSELSHSYGSTEGGLELCLQGRMFTTNVTSPPTVLLGNSPCATANTTWNGTSLCCITSKHPAGEVNVTVHTEWHGYTLSASSTRYACFR